MVDLSQYNTSPIDVSGLTGISNQLNQSYDQYNQIFSKNMENLNTSRQQYLDLIKKLQEKEDNASTGNPFIDMLNGYKNMKKQQDPNYQWQGLVGMLANKLDKAKANRLSKYQQQTDNPVLPYSPDRDKYAGQSTAPQQQEVPRQNTPWIAAPRFPQGGMVSTLPQFDREPPVPIMQQNIAPSISPRTVTLLDLMKNTSQPVRAYAPKDAPNMDLIQRMRYFLNSPMSRGK